MIKRILVALSGTPFTPSAVQHAIELARLHGAEVTGVTLIDVQRLEDVGPVPLGGGAAAHDLAEKRIRVTEERIESEVTAFEARCHEAGVPHRVERERGDALEQLTACWRYHDLTVVGLRGLFEYGILRNPDDRIVRLILSGVRPIVAVAERHHPVQRVLIAFNGSMESAAAMKRFVQLRPWGDVSVEILCVGLEDDEAARALEDAAGYCRAHGLETRTTRIPGSPTDELLDHARAHGTDLVVMGATSHRKLVRLILGETVLHAMQHADIPLFLSR